MRRAQLCESVTTNPRRSPNRRALLCAIRHIPAFEMNRFPYVSAADLKGGGLRYDLVLRQPPVPFEFLIMAGRNEISECGDSSSLLLAAIRRDLSNRWGQSPHLAGLVWGSENVETPGAGGSCPSLEIWWERWDSNPQKDAGFKPAAYANSATLPGSGGGRRSRTPRFYPPLVFRTSCQPFSSALRGGRSRDRTCAGFARTPS